MFQGSFQAPVVAVVDFAPASPGLLETAQSQEENYVRFNGRSNISSRAAVAHNI